MLGNYQGGILVTILPYIEQQDLFNYAVAVPSNTWDAAVPAPTTNVRRAFIKSYQCPSDPTMVGGGWSSAQVGGWAGSSYGANCQVFGTIRAGGNCDAPKFNLGNMPDGTSQTIMWTDVFAGCNGMHPGQTTVQNWGTLWAYPGIDWSQAWHPVIGNTRNWPATVMTVSYPSITAPLAGQPAVFAPPQFNPPSGQCDKSRSQSGHPGACQVGMADGSVRAVGPEISPVTWRSAIMADDGQPLGSDW
jgi:prepilin-type processing-associated H-X9-DG protein